MLYRILETLKYLDSGQRLEVGTINDLKRVSPESIAMLIAKGRISEVQAPPLAVLPGFEERAAVYAEEGVQTVHDMAGDEPDFDEALKWSTGYVDPDSTPFDEPLEVPDVYELKDDDDEQLGS